MNRKEIIDLDMKHLWHPCAQMKDYESFEPIVVKSASGPFLYTDDGREIIDAISSWWCKSLGHCHPQIRKAVDSQLDKFEHVILANATNETIVELSAKLAQICPPLDKVFYADNGSTSVEIAMKLSLQYHLQTGNAQKNKFLALHNGYHGESILTLAAGDCELYSKPYASILPEIAKTAPLIYCDGPDSEGWDKYPESAWREIEKQLDEMSEELSAIIFEPVVQGAGGMKIYSPDLLRKLREWADRNGAHLIADEIMTGFGRCGRMMACEYAGIAPDFACFSKGLTAGWGPMAVTLCSTEVYNAFYDDYFSGKAFMHSNTYTGYALSAAAAIAAMKIYEDENLIVNAEKKGKALAKRMEHVAQETGALSNVRGIGYIAAAEIINPETGEAFDYKLRTGYRFYQEAVKLGALLRPLGDSIYFLPPLNTPEDALDRMTEIAVKALKKTLALS